MRAMPPLMYEGTWESLRTHRVPVWYDDAKLGVFIHWGLYSVPGWAPRVPDIQQLLDQRRAPSGCCGRTRTPSGTSTPCRSRAAPPTSTTPEVYGDDYPYDNFVRTFNDASSGANLDAVADLCQAAGARYVVLTTKHHDGFALWPSVGPASGQGRVPRPPRPGRRPDRGGPRQAHAHGALLLRRLRLALQPGGPLHRPPMPCWPCRTTRAMSSTSPAHWRELIDRYQPSVLWNDISWPTDPQLPQLFAYYYNAVEEGVINDRWKEPGLPRNAVHRRASCAAPAPWCRRCGAFIPEQPQAPDLRHPEALRLPHARVRRAAHGDGAQVGAGPRRRALVRGQPSRAARGHHFRDRAHPDVLRRRVQERQPAHRRRPATRRDHPRPAAGAAARPRGVARRQRRGRSTAAGPGSSPSRSRWTGPRCASPRAARVSTRS